MVESGIGEGNGNCRVGRRRGNRRRRKVAQAQGSSQVEGAGDGGAAVRRRRWQLEDDGVAMTVEKNLWPGQGVAAVIAAAAAAATVVGPLPQPSLSSHLRGSSLLSFFK